MHTAPVHLCNFIESFRFSKYSKAFLVPHVCASKHTLSPFILNKTTYTGVYVVLLMVGEEGLEPAILTELVPKTSAYTNSATRPYL